MLILTRRVGEALRIDSEISIAVLSIQGQQARMGIQAPDSVEVHREEIFQRIQRELAASGPAHIDDRVKVVAAKVDPRQVFVRLNPDGFRPDDLMFSDTGFADEYAQRSFVVFLSGYRAALEASQ